MTRRQHRHGGKAAGARAPGGHRHGRPRLRSPRLDNALIHLERRGREGRPLGDADAAERDDARLLRKARPTISTPERAAIYKALLDPASRRRRAEVPARTLAGRILDAAHVGRADDAEGGRGRERHPVGGRSHARYPRAARRGHRRVLRGDGEGDRRPGGEDRAAAADPAAVTRHRRSTRRCIA